MYPIRCPECGLINHYDDVTFPLCGQCQTDLLRCACCRHHEGSGCSHPRAYVRYTEDGQAAKDCPDFHSRQEVRGSRLMARLPAPLWVSLLLGLILLGLLASSLFIDPRARYFVGSPLQVEMAIPSRTVVGRPFTITMRVTNLLANQPSSRYYLVLNDDFFRIVQWDAPPPSAERMEASRNRLFFEYEPLPPGGQRILQFSFRPRLGGVAPFNAQIYSPSNQLRDQETREIPVLGGGNAWIE